MEIGIHPYEDADLDAVTRIWFTGWESTGIGRVDPSLQAELRERLPREIAGGWDLYVAKADTEIVGFLALHDDRLEQLFVAPHLQSNGVGKQLLDFVKAARPEGFSLTTPTEGRAVRFYEREGLKRGQTSVHPRLGHPIVQYDWRP